MGNRQYKLDHLSRGLCVDCSDKALPGHTRCATHAENTRERSANIKYNRRKRRLCVTCACPLVDELDLNYITCFNCRHNI